MTKRDFYNSVIEANINEEMTAMAKELVNALDATNEKRRDAAAEKSKEKEAERAPKREALVGAMTGEFQTATMLIEAAGLDITPQSVPSLVKGLVEEGVVVKGDVKVPGKGKQRGYALASLITEAE